MELLKPQISMRNFELKDWKDVYEYMSTEEIHKYDCSLPWTKKDAMTFVRHYTKQDKQYVARALSSFDKVIGHVGVVFSGIDNCMGDLFVFIRKEDRRKHLAEEGIKIVLSMAVKQLKMHRITAQIDTRNMPSIKLFQKLGFKPEGILRKSQFIDGEYRDTIMFSIVVGDQPI